jgi:glycine cleavage system regulatory protein
METDNNVSRFTIVLQAEPHIDAIRNLRIALKVLKRRYGLRVVTIRET